MAPRGMSSRGGGSRGPSRGGIQKRRAPHNRLDKDGDMVMGGPTSEGSNPRRRGPSGSTRGNLAVTRARQQAIISNLTGGSLRGSRGGRGSATTSSRANQPGSNTRTPTQTTSLRVKGLFESKAASNKDGGLTDLLSFLERKAGRHTRQVTIKKNRVEAPYVYIMVSQYDAEAILKLDTYLFAGVQLEIQAVDDAFGDGTELSGAAKEAKDNLMKVLNGRYNAQIKFLDLGSLAEDPLLLAMGAFNGVMPEKLFKALMKICDETFMTPEAKRESVTVVSLAKNSLNNVEQIASLAKTFPDLKQLDLTNNAIVNLDAVRSFKDSFPQLEGLLISENPISDHPAMLREFLDWYPRLQILNHQITRTPEQAEANAQAVAKEIEASKHRKPVPIPQVITPFQDPSGIAQPFITDLILGYDSNRPELAKMYYDDDSIFSLNVDTNAPRSFQKDGAPLPWSSYIRLSRNIVKITTPNGRYQRTFIGTRQIADVWSQLPQTKHPDLSTATSEYIIDCISQPNVPDIMGNYPDGVEGLRIIIVGEFQELLSSGKTGRRSFTRTLTLAPGRPGHNQIRVIHDTLSLRAYRPIPPAQLVKTGIDPITQLVNQTGLIAEYAEMCLADVGYDYQAAIRLFESKKHELPREYFQNLA